VFSVIIKQGLPPKLREGHEGHTRSPEGQWKAVNQSKGGCSGINRPFSLPSLGEERRSDEEAKWEKIE